eukprot:Seg1803.2 transcript_id=Seg1803.2/GoldUCD/mRNA.D3Y31 product="hypothetical protein" protein_id=Seg1803.2/GoldUCD/D3Y31
MHTPDLRRLTAAPGTPVPSNTPIAQRNIYTPSAEQIVPCNSPWNESAKRSFSKQMTPRKRFIPDSPLARIGDQTSKTFLHQASPIETPIRATRRPPRHSTSEENNNQIDLFSGSSIFA